MKQTIKQILSVALAAVMVLTLTAGCNKSEPDDGSSVNSGSPNSGQNSSQISHEPTDEVYVAEFIPFPDGLGTIFNLNYRDGRIYFVSMIFDIGDADDFYSTSTESGIYSMNLDGSGLTELAGYAPPVQRPADDYGGVNINRLRIDVDGNLWVVERWDFYGYDFPDGVHEDILDTWQYRVERSSGTAVRKLDAATGAELLSVDLSALSEQTDTMYVDAIRTDDDGNVYLSVDDWEKAKRTVYILDTGGNLQSTLDDDQWGETYNPTDISGNVLPGAGSFDLLINDGANLYGYAAARESTVKLLNWIESNVYGDGIDNILMLPDERIICTDAARNAMTNEPETTLIILSKTMYSELPESNVITLAVFGLDSTLADAVTQFNRDNPSITIQIADYLYGVEVIDEDGFNNEVMRFSTEIIAGKIPDIIEIGYLPYREYVNKGFFADLYPFIDADPEFNRDSFVDGVLRATETDGKLFRVFPTFSVNCMFGNPSVIGSGTGWTMAEFMSVLDDNPNADMPIGQYTRDMDFLRMLVSLGMDEFIDWDNGKAHFDSPEFTKLLEYCSTLLHELYDDNGRPIYPDLEDITDDEAIAAGRQIIRQADIWDFYYVQLYKTWFGGELAIKGLPSASRNGITLSPTLTFVITENSKNKEAAWAFLRTMLDGNWQLSNNMGLPVNRDAFDYTVSEALAGKFMQMYTGPMAELTQADMDKVRSLISNAKSTASWHIDPPLWNIIKESAADYFNGRCSAEEAADIIQSKAAIYVSERS